ncbi:hypothetical protein, partial [Streptomyces alkaliphilus]|uniref:hypothetical protein n=1 Tax=Streptomyces alkaliphilus TaxID=1472722 RepID=UPI001E47D95C
PEADPARRTDPTDLLVKDLVASPGAPTGTLTERPVATGLLPAPPTTRTTRTTRTTDDFPESN